VIVDYEAKTIAFHQSWINDYYICGERARRGIIDPELMRRGSDATILGTGMHGYAEARLLGEDRAAAMAAGFAALEVEFALPHVNNGLSDQQVVSFLPTMCAAWELKILPHVELGGVTERKFRTLIGVWNGWSIYLEGMIDYVEPSGKIWDWKTAGREYTKWEKERWAVQPTAYAAGAVAENLAQYPVTWAYGVVTKSPMKDPKVQIIEFQRHQGHAEWLREQIYVILDQHFDPGDDEQAGDGRGLDVRSRWLLNDQSALCSEKWCPAWATCKGRFV
jgi:hypothetical protein